MIAGFYIFSRKDGLPLQIQNSSEATKSGKKDEKSGFILSDQLSHILEKMPKKTNEKESKYIVSLPNQKLNPDSLFFRKEGEPKDKFNSLAKRALIAILSENRSDVALSFSENLINPSLYFKQGNVGRKASDNGSSSLRGSWITNVEESGKRVTICRYDHPKVKQLMERVLKDPIESNSAPEQSLKLKSIK